MKYQRNKKPVIRVEATILECTHRMTTGLGYWFFTLETKYGVTHACFWDNKPRQKRQFYPGYHYSFVSHWTTDQRSSLYIYDVLPKDSNSVSDSVYADKQRKSPPFLGAGIRL